MKKRVLAILFLFAVSSYAQIDPDLLAGMKARAIGTAAASGRISSIDVVTSNTDIVYVGTAAGGVWKSTNGGLSFNPIFDDQPVASIGAVAVDPSSPETVWVGTGEGNPRNSVSVGGGVFRTTDGGKTWQSLGLEKTSHIHRVIVHPTNPNVAWVAALGQNWGTNPDRGVFKTDDGGKTWRKVLYVDERTGAGDLIIDPKNPNKLFAAMWEYRRWPWFFNSGGPGSGLYVTYDGGEHWKRYTAEDGLPKGNLGRMGLAISRSNPNVVYALVEADKSALIRSEDGGLTWKSVNTETDVAPRPFYFADIRVDPEDPNRVYSMWTQVSVSDDGGRKFTPLIPYTKVHPDYHAMWLDPNDPKHLWVGNDGGIAESRDRGASWRYVGTLPVGQYYHIAADMDQPYHTYGGLQDNGSWRCPSTTWDTEGIRNYDCEEVGFGDGFTTLPLPGDSMQGYATSQQLHIIRWNLRTGERKDIRPSGPDGTELRFNWNAAMSLDPFEPNGIYAGSQFVHKSSDRGEHWTIISPDLTTNRKEWQNQFKSGGLTIDASGAENFTTIITIAPSATEKGVIWAGTDDGRVQVTRDGGANWTSVEAGIKGVPANTWVPEIKASPYAGGTAFVVLDNHRREDLQPYVYRTTDYGKTWTSLVTKDIQGYALSIEQDPVDPDLLFLGTEFGLFFSQDAGKSWMKWKHGIPTTSVMGLLVHPRENDLLVATHGRSVFVIDDIRPLRSVSKATMAEPAHFFDVADAQQFRRRQHRGSRFVGDGEFRGPNRTYGALLTYSLNLPNLPLQDDEKERDRKEKARAASATARIPETGVPVEAKDIVKEPEAERGKQAQTGEQAKPGEEEREPRVDFTVTDASGKVLRKFKGPARLGVNRASWDLARDAFKRPPRPQDEEEEDFRGNRGPEVPPGTYTITMKFKGNEAKQTVKVLGDPRQPVSDADRTAKWNAILRAGTLQESVTEAVERIMKTRADIDAISAKLKKPEGESEGRPDPLIASGKKLKEQLEAMEHRLWDPPKSKGITPPTDIMSMLGQPMGGLQSSFDAPTPAQLAWLARAEAAYRALLPDYNKLFAEDVAKYRDAVRKQNVELFQEYKPMTF
ncbi:MAG TPA: hypothetical protein VLV78_16870 [Thermoanaerobaculia bacterium]|nr:hypothetical protein [Thermoanaerobaculia bacterium]